MSGQIPALRPAYSKNFSWPYLMEILGVEPKTSCLQSKRATNCAKFPKKKIKNSMEIPKKWISLFLSSTFGCQSTFLCSGGQAHTSFNAYTF
jgi:hypothetical protein